MRNIKYALHSVAALAVASLTACSNDDGMEENPSGIQKTVTLTAWQPGSDSQTRVGFDSNGKAYWQEGDAIGVIPSSGNTFSSFSITSGAGTGKATFTGTVTGEVGSYAVYPYNSKCKLMNNTLYYYLPDSYTYESVDQTFFPEGKDGKSFCMPMYGTVTDNVVKFRNLGGVVCLLVDKMPAGSGTVTVTESTNKLCGSVVATLTDETPEIKTKTSSSNNTVAFNFSNAIKGNSGVFYLPVATGTYNLTVKVEGGDKTSTTTLDAMVITRTKLQAVKVVTDYGTDDTDIIVINGHKFVDLGLPSGLLWAETNIGAESATDYGNYFAWGETEPKVDYSWSTYKFNLSESDDYNEDDIYKYNNNDELTILEAEDDAATTNWGASCRMPTSAECEELNNEENCTWTWKWETTSTGDIRYGYEVKSTKNGKSIFLPASGFYKGENRDEIDCEWHGCYWSRSLNSDIMSYVNILTFSCYRGEEDHIFHNCDKGMRCYGFPVRPVAEP